MTLTVALLLLLAIAMEITREICFKLAADQQSESRYYLLRLIGTPLTWAGFASWGIEVVAWIKTLSYLPLNIAFPAMSLAYCGTIIASRYFLDEPVAPRKWIGVVLVTMGVAIIGSQGVG